MTEDPKDAKLREYLEQIEALKAQLGGDGEEYAFQTESRHSADNAFD
jgi:hypothetical protein